MGQSDSAAEWPPTEVASDPAGEAASRRVSRGLMRALEVGQLAPGQRLVESELARQFGVGRNAVREAIQWLAAKGVIDATRYRSAAIRALDAEETGDVLDIAEALLALIARNAALRYDVARHVGLMDAAMLELEQADAGGDEAAFSRARRHLYGVLLEIGASRELQRMFPALGLHIAHAQYRAHLDQRRALDDFRALAAAVAGGHPRRAQAVAHDYVDHLRAGVRAAADRLTSGVSRTICG